MGAWEIPTCNKNFVYVVKRGSTRCVRSIISSEAQQKQVENLSVIAQGWLSSYKERLFGSKCASQLDLLVRSSYLRVNIFFSSGLPPFPNPCPRPKEILDTNPTSWRSASRLKWFVSLSSPTQSVGLLPTVCRTVGIQLVYWPHCNKMG